FPHCLSMNEVKAFGCSPSFAVKVLFQKLLLKFQYYGFHKIPVERKARYSKSQLVRLPCDNLKMSCLSICQRLELSNLKLLSFFLFFHFHAVRFQWLKPHLFQ